MPKKTKEASYSDRVSVESANVFSRVWTWVLATTPRLYREVAKFGIVGLVAFVVDVGVFNLALYTSGSPLEDKPLSAKGLSVVLATIVAYLGNRHWTFKTRSTPTLGKGYALFFLLNGVAMLIAVGCLAFSHYVLGFDSPLADNIAANGVGLVLGTIFRFWSYRKFVFPAMPRDEDRKALMGTVEL